MSGLQFLKMTHPIYGLINSVNRHKLNPIFNIIF